MRGPFCLERIRVRSLGHHDEALDLFKWVPETVDTISLKAEWLVRLDRPAEAVALLEQKLPLDNRIGTLRQMLESLTGKPARGEN